MKPILEVHKISKKFKIQHLSGGYLSLRERLFKGFTFKREETEDFWALDDVSFEVKAGESIGIIGRNGAGKSTLLKILSKITPPTKGKIISRGRVASLLEVGTGFHPELTGRENIFFNGSLLGMKRKEIQSKFDEIVDFSGVEKFLDTPLKHYSSGMQLRLAFAVAAFLEPEILIIDEVLAVGDAEFQKKCLGKMEDVSKSGRTILFVSHNMGAVKNLCSQCILIESGSVKFIGDTDIATDRYLSSGLSNTDQNSLSFQRPVHSALWMDHLYFNNQLGGRGILYYGDKLILKLKCKATSVTNGFIGFVISSVDGIKLLNGNNRYQQFRLLIDPAKDDYVFCDLGVLPLMEGSYSITLYLGNENRDEHVIENAVIFDVIERDVWGNGKLPPKRASYLWWTTNFYHE